MVVLRKFSEMTMKNQRHLMDHRISINMSFKKLFEKEKIGSMLSINLEC